MTIKIMLTAMLLSMVFSKVKAEAKRQGDTGVFKVSTYLTAIANLAWLPLAFHSIWAYL